MLTDGPRNDRCLKREGDTASLVPCEDSTLTFTFALLQDAEVEAMSSQESKLGEAANRGDTAAVKQFLKDGISAKGTDWEGAPVLSAAASGGHLDIVKLLLSKVCVCVYCSSLSQTRT